MAETFDPRLIALSNVLLVEVEARKAETLRDLLFVIANDTGRVVPYRNATVWEVREIGAPRLVAASHVSDVDTSAPFVQWFDGMLPTLAAMDPTMVRPLVASDFPAASAERWPEFLAPFAVHVPLRSPTGVLLGGLFLSGETPYNEGQITLLEQLAGAYGHAWRAVQPRASARWQAHFLKHRKRYLAAAVILLLLPVRQYVLAPAEVVPLDPVVVASPMDGVVEQIEVQPGQTVSAGAALFRLEDTALVNDLAVARKAYAVAEAEYLKNAQDAFVCDSCRGRLPELQARMDMEGARTAWAEAQLERSRVKAPEAGVAVVGDPNDWRGRPVQVGERVMILARPAETRLRISLPVEDARSIDVGTEVVFYLNVSPLDSYDATISRTSYDAVQLPDQSLGYILLADFTDEKARLGLRGTAKVYGARAPIIFHILRRPVAWLRRTLGI